MNQVFGEAMTATANFTIGKVKKLSAEAQAADTLREAIITGSIPLGSRLTEILVAEQVGVSRGTIRTAFHQLVKEGLLVQVPYTGWTVMTLSSHDAWELYTLRASLESLASQLVARRIKADSSAQLAAHALADAFDLLKKACSSGDRLLIAQEDMKLHKTIVSLSDHGRLNDQYAHIENLVRVYIQSSDRLVPNPSTIVQQHEPIVDSLLRGDEVAAMGAAISHNEHEGKILVEHLAQMEAIAASKT